MALCDTVCLRTPLRVGVAARRFKAEKNEEKKKVNGKKSKRSQLGPTARHSDRSAAVAFNCYLNHQDDTVV
jgi:hypothetical protein